MHVMSHIIKKGKNKVWDTSEDFFTPICSREYFRTVCFNELLMSFASDESYRKCEGKINRVRWQEEDITQSRTIANVIEREGAEIQKAIERKADAILKEHGFDNKGKPLGWNGETVTIPESDLLENEFVDKAIDEYNEEKEREMQIEICELQEVFENPFATVNISLDEVGVKKQKETGRKKHSPKKEHKEYIRNTIAHIQNSKEQYILNGLDLCRTLKVLSAFLLSNNLIKKGQLLFFVDGARDLHKAIKKVFGWVPFRIILDWYHLKKKCQMQLSLALNNKEARNEVLEKVLSYLWLGKIYHVQSVLKEIDTKHIKNKGAIDVLIGYFDRNYSYIPCYALRKKLGLRNSSNRGEKANDLVVADRQKHNGMSWSRNGSSSLATVKALHLNNEQSNWLLKKDITFKMKKRDVAS